MARSSESTRDRILAAAYGLLYREGFARVSVDAIAQEAGLTKRTLYYHFESKDALVAAVLEFQHARVLERIDEWADVSSDNPRHMLETLFDGLARWASEPNWTGSGFTRIAMELADLPGHPARAAAAGHKRSVEAWLAEQFADRRVAEPEEAARQIMVLTEGCLSLMLIHRDRGYARSAAAIAQKLITVDD